jgi:hypothetical protein
MNDDTNHIDEWDQNVGRSAILGNLFISTDEKNRVTFFFVVVAPEFNPIFATSKDLADLYTPPLPVLSIGQSFSGNIIKASGKWAGGLVRFRLQHFFFM